MRVYRSWGVLLQVFKTNLSAVCIASCDVTQWHVALWAMKVPGLWKTSAGPALHSYRWIKWWIYVFHHLSTITEVAAQCLLLPAEWQQDEELVERQWPPVTDAGTSCGWLSLDTGHDNNLNSWWRKKKLTTHHICDEALCNMLLPVC